MKAILKNERIAQVWAEIVRDLKEELAILEEELETLEGDLL